LLQFHIRRSIRVGRLDSGYRSSADPEKGVDVLDVSSEGSPISGNFTPLPVYLPKAVTKWKSWIKSLRGLEARGITRALPEERKVPSRLAYVQMSILWFSANVTANQLVVGLLGPLLFGPGFLDSPLIVTFACSVGWLGPAYKGIWVVQSGNRTKVRIPYAQETRRLVKRAKEREQVVAR
jgi:hypothetical protein